MYSAQMGWSRPETNPCVNENSNIHSALWQLNVNLNSNNQGFIFENNKRAINRDLLFFFLLCGGTTISVVVAMKI